MNSDFNSFQQAAAEALAHLDTGMQYPAEVGVNSYVKVKLSFLQKQVNVNTSI